MNFNEYLTQTLAKDDELRKEYEALESEYKSIAETIAEESNVQKVTDFLERLGIQVKTEYGNYRPTYDVLRDIGDAMSRT